MSKAAELANLIGNINAGGGTGQNKNVIINSGMTVSQRGTSFASALGYTLDRYGYYRSGDGAVTVSQDTDTPSDFKNSLKIAVTTNDSSVTSGDYYILQQKIEGQNMAHFNYGSSDAKTTCLSFFVKSSVTGTYSGSLRNNASDRSFVFEYTVSSANTWEQKSITIVGDTSGTWLTDNSSGIVLAFSLGQGTTYASSTVGSWHSGNYHGSTSEQDFITNASATFFITGVQLEVGQNPTEFEHEPFDRTLAKCQRYFEKTDREGSDTYRISENKGTTSASYYYAIDFRVTKRAKPTTTISQSYDDSFTLSVHSSSTGRNHMGVVSANTGSTDTRALAEFTWTADAEL